MSKGTFSSSLLIFFIFTSITRAKTDSISSEKAHAHFSNSSGLGSENLIGGYVAQQDAFKYYVSLRAGNSHHCGGAIIHDYFILTAAHCFITPNKAFTSSRVLVATRNARTIREADIIAEIQEISVPRHFELNVVDIAVVKTLKSLRLSENPRLSAISLPKNDQSYVGMIGTICGSGYDWVKICKNNEGKMYKCEYNTAEYRLKFARVNILENESCRGNFQGTFNMKPSFVCGRLQQYKDRVDGICGGDSGGPLTIGGVVVGVVSTGPSTCNERQMATAYTKVASFKWFISAVRAGAKDPRIRVAVYNSYYSRFVEIRGVSK